MKVVLEDLAKMTRSIGSAKVSNIKHADALHRQELNVTLRVIVAFWIALTFLTMLMPALVCFSKLKRDKRHTFRHSLTELQKA